MLGQPIYMLMPEVVGFKLMGQLPEGATATDLVLVVTQMLREKGVVGKFVEFYGPGLSSMTLPDRATIANMAPEYGATMGFFPVDDEVLSYLRRTGRDEDLVGLVEVYCKEQGLFRSDATPDPAFNDTLELDLSMVEPSVAGPLRPQDRILVSQLKPRFNEVLTAPLGPQGFALSSEQLGALGTVRANGDSAELTHGSVVIAAITSCTNTSNPSVMVAAGLLAKNANERGLTSKSYVKTSLAPGSKVVTEYLDKAGLTPHLEALGFHTVGYGCTTCIGNSGPLPEPVREAIHEADIVAASVLSGNRNFGGRIGPDVRANFWRRRRWWWHTRWRAQSTSTWPASRSGLTPRARMCICATSGRARRRSCARCRTASMPACIWSSTAMSTMAIPSGMPYRARMSRCMSGALTALIFRSRHFSLICRARRRRSSRYWARA